MHFWLVGRAADCDIVIDDPAVENYHCLIRGDTLGLFLEDLNSEHGTYVDGHQIARRTPIFAANRITIAGRNVRPPVDTVPSQTRNLMLIGRSRECDFVLDSLNASALHAAVRVTYQDTWLLDLGSRNGTYLAGNSAPIEKSRFSAADTVFFGSFEVPGHRLSAALSTFRPANVVRCTFRGNKPFSIGSDADNDWQLRGPGVESKHAMLTRAGGGAVLHACTPEGACWHYGNKIDRGTKIRSGDLIVFGNTRVIIAITVDVGPINDDCRVSLRISNVSVSISGKKIIEDVSLFLGAGELVGLMGMSGAGKSTLMSVANGYLPPTTGQVWLGQSDLYRNYRLVNQWIGYVPQDDIIHSNLTVAEALFFRARLRMPNHFSNAQICAKVVETMNDLSLTECANVLIGSPDRKGISGGQRKRVNLAMELLTDPPILFLDEPTSGLSSADVTTVMGLLRDLADAGRTILLTIHQPSLDAYQLLDKVVALGRSASSKCGHVAFFGPAFPDALDFFRPQDRSNHRSPMPDDILDGLNGCDTKLWERKYQESRIATENTTNEVDVQPSLTTTHRPLGLIRATKTLLQRTVRVKARDYWYSGILFLQAPIIGLLISVVFGREAKMEATNDKWPTIAAAVSQSIFLVTLAAVWFGCSNAAREIVGEWSIFRRERMLNLSLVSYLLSKFICLGAFCVLQCLILLVIVSRSCDLHWPAMQAFGILSLASLAGVGIGLFISAVSRSSEMAIACLPIIILPLVTMSGSIQPLRDIGAGGRAVSQWLPTRWAFEALVVLEAENRDKWSSPLQVGKGSEHDIAERFFPVSWGRSRQYVVALVLSLMVPFWGGATALALKLRDVH